jgi:essential nuclear protein 1
MPRDTTKKSTARHDPLHHVIGKDEELERFGRVSQPGRRKKKRRSDDEDGADQASLHFFFVTAGCILC